MKFLKFMRKSIKLFFVLTFIGMLAISGLYVYAKMNQKLEIKSANAFLMYDNNEELFFQGNGNQEWINLEDISPYLINATLSTEDKRFYDHYGFDFIRIAKALYVNISSKQKKEGASTISQQYARNLFLNFDKTWERKLNEMWITIELESHYTKDEILEGYLNTINYGHGMYGIENASKYYFDKSSKDLSLAEAALLTGIPKSPSYYSPFVNFDLAKTRQVNILYMMYKNGYITESEYEKSINEELKLIGKKEINKLTSVSYYQDAVMKELEKLNIPKSYLETGGIKIYTNLDMNAQKILEDSVNNNLDKEDDIQTSAIMMDPKTGKVIAIIGGRDYTTSQYNRAYSSERQVGSTMKPILYYAALENGFTSSTTFTSEATTFTFSNNQTYSPQNYGETYAGKPISLATAISYSDNIYAVKTHMFLGEETLVNMAKRLGITSKIDQVPSLALGTASINMLEFASAYSAFANEGNKVNPSFVNKVEDLNGNILYEKNYETEVILNKSLTYILNNLLTTTYDSDYIDYSYPTAIGIAPKIKHTLALKSGTTDTDHWSIGYNQDIVTAVWVGYDDNKSLSVADYKYSRNIWVEAMENYLKDKENNWYEMPSNVVGVLVNPITGKPATNEDKIKKILYYIKGTEPGQTEMVFDELLETNQN